MNRKSRVQIAILKCYIITCNNKRHHLCFVLLFFCIVTFRFILNQKLECAGLNYGGVGLVVIRYCMYVMWVCIHVTVTWKRSCDCHVTGMWLACDCMWLSCDSCVGYVTSCDCHVNVILWSCYVTVAYVHIVIMWHSSSIAQFQCNNPGLCEERREAETETSQEQEKCWEWAQWIWRRNLWVTCECLKVLDQQETSIGLISMCSQPCFLCYLFWHGMKFLIAKSKRR